MENEFITVKSGKLNEYLHHIGIKTKMLSIFVGEFEHCSILFDSSTSIDYKQGLR
jgi:hypothetical protein